MRKNSVKNTRINEEVMRELSNIIRLEVKDPRISPVTSVVSVEVDEEAGFARVVVPDDKLSLAIGKEGQNARLAAKLTNFKIDIKSQSQAAAEGDDFDDYDEDDEEEITAVTDEEVAAAIEEAEAEANAEESSDETPAEESTDEE